MEKVLFIFLLIVATCVRAQSLVESGNPSPAFWVLVAVGGLVLIIIAGMLIWWWCFPVRGDAVDGKRVMDASGNLIVVEGTKAAMWGSPNAYQGVMGQTRVEGRLPIPLFSATGPRSRRRVVEMEGIDISGLDKVKLLHLLWKEAAPGMMFSMGEVPFSKEAATEAVTGYIDGFAGRLIEMDLSKDQINPFYYDGEYGQGEVARIVAELRAGQ